MLPPRPMRGTPPSLGADEVWDPTLDLGEAGGSRTDVLSATLQAQEPIDAQ